MSDNIAAELDKRIETQAQAAAAPMVFKSHLHAQLAASFSYWATEIIHPSTLKKGASLVDFANSTADIFVEQAWEDTAKRVRQEVTKQTCLPTSKIPPITDEVIAFCLSQTFDLGAAVQNFLTGISAAKEQATR